MKKRLIAVVAAALLAAVALVGTGPAASSARGGNEWESAPSDMVTGSDRQLAGKGNEWESQRGNEWE